MIRIVGLLFVLILAMAGASPASAVPPPAQPLLQAGHPEGPSGEAWERFLKAHPGWAAWWHPLTRRPHRAFGPAFGVTGVGSVDQTNAVVAARRFLLEHEDLLGLDPKHLRATRTLRAGRVWHVGFQQVWNGLPVRGTEVEVRLSLQGAILAFGIEVYDGIDVTPPRPGSPAVDPGVAASASFPGMRVVGSFGEEELLPLRDGDRVTFHRVVAMDLESATSEQRTRVSIDLADGAILDSRSLTHHGSGTQRGAVRPVLPSDADVLRLFPWQYIQVDGVTQVTDAAGGFSLDAPDTVTLTGSLRGPFVSVFKQDGPSATLTLEVPADTTIALAWTDDDSHAAERTAFYHVNVVHDRLLEVEPTFTAMNFPLACRVNTATPCNAWYDGTAINFSIAGGNCINAATSPSTIYHEYGHVVNRAHYILAGRPQGMVNQATHEALADVLACFLEDDPRFARGFFGPGTVSRRLDNTRRYPDNVVGQEHTDGLILGGAFWDLRQRVGLDTAFLLSHMAKYGTPDDPDFGVACREWFLEVLLADDDDGDLGNGTPHDTDIAFAFAAHGIGASHFLGPAFRPNAPDAALPGEPIAVTVAVPAWLRVEGPVSVVYSTDGFVTQDRVMAGLGNPGEVRALIPGHPHGTLLHYYVDVEDPWTGTHLFRPEVDTYDALIGGSRTLAENDFEEPGDWVVSAPQAAANTGVWERGVPQRTDNSAGVVVQPSWDHTLRGTRCWVTGAAGGADYLANDVSNGTTWLTSPRFDLSQAQDPVLEYWYWYSNDAGPSPGTERLELHVSNDDGDTWSQLRLGSVSTHNWVRVRSRITPVLALTDSMLFRFSASDVGTNTAVEALVDDVRILDPDEETPVRLLSLTAEPQADGAVLVQWAVTEEDPASTYVLHRDTHRLATRPADGNGTYLALDRSPGSGTHSYRLSLRARDGRLRFLGEQEVTVSTALALAPPSPNPSSASESVLLRIQSVEPPTSLTIFDARGRRVRSLQSVLSSVRGEQRVFWDGRDEAGRRVAAGVYAVRLITPQATLTRRLVRLP